MDFFAIFGSPLNYCLKTLVKGTLHYLGPLLVMINILIFTKTDRTSNNTGQHIIRKDNEKGGKKLQSSLLSHRQKRQCCRFYATKCGGHSRGRSLWIMLCLIMAVQQLFWLYSVVLLYTQVPSYW